MRNTTTIQSGYHLIFRHLFSVCLACLSVLLIYTFAHAAGINTDGSLGPATTLTPGGPKGNDYTIPSNLGQQKGSNLFHSFGNFNVNTGESATFTGSAGTANVIGRVTGGNSSWIDGRLGCDITGANLWLLNPFGILFGPNASLNVNGSFHASTADYLQLSDGGVFYTDPSKTSKLTIAAPAAFGFLSSHPKEITISGSNLTVESGKTLSLIGGNINIVNGQLIAPSGKINLVSLASPGVVIMDKGGITVEGSPELGDIRISTTTDETSQLLSTTHAASTVLQPRVGTDESIDRFAQSSLLQNKMAGQASSSLIDVSGSKEDATSGGSVDIYCKTFSLDNSGISSDNYSNYKGGKIRLVAEESVSIGNLSAISSWNYGEGAGGDIDIQTGYLALTNVGQILAVTYGIGDGGDVSIKAKNVFINAGFVFPEGYFPSWIACQAVSKSLGNAGNITIDTESLTLSNGGRISAATSGIGNSGNVTIKAKDVLIDGEFEIWESRITCQTNSGTGDAGSLHIDTESLTLSNGGRLEASTYGDGDGGNITIKAKDVLITGGFESSSSSRVNPSVIVCQSFAGSTGNAGSLNIDTKSLTLSNGGRLYATTSGSRHGGDVSIKAKDVLIDGGFESSNGNYFSSINNTAKNGSTGDAGSTNIDTESLTLSNGGRISAGTFGSGDGGKVSIKAKDVLIDGGFESSNDFSLSMITCQTQSTGNSGSINIDTESLTLSNCGQISASTSGSGNGGDVTIKAMNVSIGGGFESSNGVYASVINCGAYHGSTGNAGSLNLDTESLALSNGGQISASTSGSGNGGDVTIKAMNVSIDGGFESSNGVYASGINCRANSGSTGNAGSLNLDTESLALSSGGQISASTYRSGDGGDVTIKAKDVSIDGGFESSNGFVHSMITCESGSIFSGKAGDISLKSDTLSMSNGGEISVKNSGKKDGGSININVANLNMNSGAVISSSSTGTGDAGNIVIAANDSMLLNDATITVEASKASAGDIKIQTPNLDMTNTSHITASVSGGSGSGGHIDLNVDTLSITEGSRIKSNTAGSGSGGNITVAAGASVTISGKTEEASGIYGISTGAGSAGSITVKTPTLNISDSGEISTSSSSTGTSGSIDIQTKSLEMNSGASISSASTGTGDAGSIMIAAKDSMLLNDAVITVEANSASAGDIKIQTPNLDMTNTSQITASVSGGSGSGGSIDLNVDTLSITEGSRIESNTAGSGSGGNITVAAGTSVTISGKTEEASGMYSTSTGAGSAGSITVKTPTLNISDAGEISSSASGTGPGGSIDINVANLTMNSGAVISSASTGTGDAGSINLTIADKLESRNSTITTESTQADGGDITITNTGFLTYLINSSITATVGGGPQTTGGNIRINSPYIVLKDSHVIANAYEGKGGNIGITADTYLADWTSTVSASSTLGISGQVDINSPLVNLSGLLSPLPTTFADITELLADDCETRYKYRKVSSLVVRGRDALPAQPGDLWPSPVMMR